MMVIPMLQVFWAGIMGTSVLTSLHITVYSALRFVSLKWPHKFRRYTIRHAKVSTVISFFLMDPSAYLELKHFCNRQPSFRKVQLYKSRFFFQLTVMCLWIISFFSGSVPFLIWMAPLWFDRSKLLFAQAIPACGVMIKW